MCFFAQFRRREYDSFPVFHFFRDVFSLFWYSFGPLYPPSYHVRINIRPRYPTNKRMKSTYRRPVKLMTMRQIFLRKVIHLLKIPMENQQRRKVNTNLSKIYQFVYYVFSKKRIIQFILYMHVKLPAIVFYSILRVKCLKLEEIIFKSYSNIIELYD